MSLDLEKLKDEELINLCKENKIETFNIKTKKNYSKKTLISNLSKMINNNSNLNIETKLKNCIKTCHNYLYSNGSIVGNDASNDIIRIFILKVISYLYSNNENRKIILNKIENLKTNESYDRYLTYLEKFSNLTIISDGCDDINSNYEDYMDDVIRGSILSLIFSESNDYILNTRKENRNIFKLIEELDKIEINEKTIEEFSTISIYEYFNSNYEGKSTSKKLGQFFTPKKMINCILNNCNFINLVLEFENPFIYDPCCGTGGLLCNLYNSCKNIKPNNIYGTEIHNDTIKYALASLLLSTNSLFENLYKGCSLSNNKFLFENKKFDIIFTNPPFGTTLKYKEIKEKFNNNKPSNLDIKFEDVFPFDTNTGINLFIQLIIYLLNENGIACIILPDGEIMDGKTSIKFRKFIIENCKVMKIISFPQNAFEYTSIKTNVLILKKIKNENNDNDKNVEFIEVNKECNEAKTIGIKDLNDNHSFHFNDEINEKLKEIEGVEYKKLGEVCKVNIGGTPSRDINEYYQNGNNLWVSVRELNRGYIYDTTEKITDLGIKNSNVKLLEKDSILFSFKLSIGKTAIAGKPLYTNEAIAGILSKDNNLLNNKYLYNYLTFNNFSKFGRGLIGNGSLNKKSLEEIKIPIPSLEVQEEIIKKCEFLTDFNKKLEENIKELKECDKIEYECFKRIIYNSEKEIKSLGEVCEFQNGKGIKKDKLINGEYPVIGGGQKPMGFHNEYNRNENTILCSSSGAYAGFISKYDKKVWASDCFSIILKNNLLNNNYLYYFLKNIQENIYKLKTGLAQPHVYSKDLERLKIPIPSLEVQEKFINYCENRNNNSYNTHIKIIEKTIEDNKKLMKELFNFQ